MGNSSTSIIFYIALLVQLNDSNGREMQSSKTIARLRSLRWHCPILVVSNFRTGTRERDES